MGRKKLAMPVIRRQAATRISIWSIELSLAWKDVGDVSAIVVGGYWRAVDATSAHCQSLEVANASGP